MKATTLRPLGDEVSGLKTRGKGVGMEGGGKMEGSGRRGKGLRIETERARRAKRLQNRRKRNGQHTSPE